MPDPTPLPVRVVEIAPVFWEYLDKGEDAYRLAMFLGAFAAVLVVALLGAILVTTGLRR